VALIFHHTLSSFRASLPLTGARQLIVQCLTPLQSETVSLDQALGRFPIFSQKSTLPKPSYDQSTRDGYGVVEPRRLKTDAAFELIAEIAAGSLSPVALSSGQAVRIMTGARIPAGCSRVVPFEICREEGNRVRIPARALQSTDRFIRRRGQDLPVGRVIAGAGIRVTPDHLLMLAENGLTSMPVYRKPGVVILCTGSELVAPGREMRDGQKISGNGVLLQGLVEEAGGRCLRQCTAADTGKAISSSLEELLALKPDMIITTGGMGPGKFDLLEQVFARLEGELLYNSLQVRPGKSTMFGFLSGVPFFGLPGPPPAVRLLFHELVAPSLYRLQGMRRPISPLHKARLLESLSAGKSAHLNLKGGVIVFEDASLCVRLAGRQDAVSAVLYLRGNKRSFAAGEIVPVHIVRPFYGC
jgi:molybdopterin molybdotransferase